MKKAYKISRGDFVFVVIFVFLAGFIGGVTFTPQNIATLAAQPRASVTGERVIEMGIPAVDEDGNGVVGKIAVAVRPGTGKTNVNVDNVISFPSFQESAKEARAAASAYTKTDLGTVDIDFDVQVNASVIEGPSAGASMAAAIVLALQGEEAPQNIMMTGSILENGTVTPVGSIFEKAAAAKNAGATVFLVPAGQGSQLSSTRTRTCDYIGRLQICRVNYQYNPVNIGQSLNITVQEVSTLSDVISALKKYSEDPVSV
jgi:predicted S18 family serine protease